MSNLGTQETHKGIIDNGSGVSLVLDMLKKMDNAKYEPNNDIVFSFVNAEEVFTYTSNSGGYQLSAKLCEKYQNILNINLDCLGEVDAKTIHYGSSIKINQILLNEFIELIFRNDEYTLEKESDYSSDNINFTNTMFFYNMNTPNSFIHTTEDNLSKVDIDSLSKISKMIYKLFRYIDVTDMKEIIS